VLAGYAHFASLARSVQWDESAIDLRADAAAWPALDPPLRRRVEVLLAGFQVGEAAVAEHLGPFAAFGPPAASEVFAAQARDEERHARFFARAWAELAGTAADPRDALTPAFLDLFDRQLPAVVRDLATEDLPLSEAVGLYHMVLEGGVFTAGQATLLELLEDARGLTGLRHGTGLVLRDERWHVGFGTRCLLDAAVPAGTLTRLQEAGARAVRAWGPAIPRRVAERTLFILHRRLAVVEAGVRTGGGRVVEAV